MTTRSTLTAQQIAAIGAGASPEQVLADASLQTPEAVAEAERLAAEAAEKLKADADAAAALAADKGENKGEATPPADAGVVAFLTTSLADKDKALLDATVSNRDLQARVTAMEATHAPLLEIARGSIMKMQVALGGTAVDLTTVDPATLLATHAEVAAKFTAKFPVGGVAAISSKDELATRAVSNVTDLDVARQQLVKFGKKKQ